MIENNEIKKENNLNTFATAGFVEKNAKSFDIKNAQLKLQNTSLKNQIVKNAKANNEIAKNQKEQTNKGSKPKNNLVGERVKSSTKFRVNNVVASNNNLSNTKTLVSKKTNEDAKPNKVQKSVQKTQAPIKTQKSVRASRNTTHAVSKPKSMKVIFLGGVGEIGKNMTAFEYDDQILVLDCGCSFPSSDMPGIDLVIPDTTYLKDNIDKVVGFVITHGHEDHIGAIPYVLKDIKAPIYSSRLTNSFIEKKLTERNIKNVQLNTVKSHVLYDIGKFKVEFVDVNHSIADSFAIVIKTPAGTIFHSGDFKIDFKPIDRKVIDLTRIAELGQSGVDLMLCESTNVERPGYTESETDIAQNLDKVFKENIGRRIFVATFSSNIYRMQQIIALAIKYGRKVATVGRSIVNNLEVANKIGKISFPKSTYIDIDKVKNYEDGKILVLCTGSQGEPSAALSRLASGEFSKIEIDNNDTIILSSYPIPGNESDVNRVVNNLSRKGALVIQENVHASGHACEEELKTMHSLVKPKNFIPVHGEYRHLSKHIALATSLGENPKNMIIAENGDVIELKNKEIQKVGTVKTGEVLIDGYGVGDMSSVVLRDRKQLSEDGIAVVTIAIGKQSRVLLNEPIIMTRGLVYSEEAETLNAEIKQIVLETLKVILQSPTVDWEEAKNIIRRPLRNFFNKKMGRMPVILPVIMFI